MSADADGGAARRGAARRGRLIAEVESSTGISEVLIQ